jgi:hypothetical protein
MYQPVGSAVFVVLPAVFESVLNVSVGMAASSVVRETLPVPVSAMTRETSRAQGTSTKAAMMMGSRRRRTEAVCLLVKGKVDTGSSSFLELMLLRASALRFGETREDKVAALGFYRIYGRASSSEERRGSQKKGR